jgi:hypothetical protein
VIWTRDTICSASRNPATVEALQMNNAYVVEARRFWVFAGWHLPMTWR